MLNCYLIGFFINEENCVMCFPNVAEVQIVLIVRSSALIKAPKVLNLSRGAGNPWACLEGFSCVSWLPGQVQPCSQ